MDWVIITHNIKNGDNLVSMSFKKGVEKRGLEVICKALADNGIDVDVFTCSRGEKNTTSPKPDLR